MKKIITIIGASGEVGFKLVEQLSNTYHLKCIVRNKNKKDFSGIKNVELIEIKDISHTEKLSIAITNSHAIINTGYIWFAKDIFIALEKSKTKPEHIIFTGSTGILTKLPSNGAQQKRDAENFIRENYSIPWTIIRPTMIFGHTNDRNISRLAKVLNKTPLMPLIGKGENLIQPVYINDLIKAFEIAVLNKNHFYKSYNIGGRFPLTNKDLFNTVARVLNKKVWFIAINPNFMTKLLSVLAIFKIKPISREQILRFQEDKNIELASFIEAFNFEPISFEEGVSHLITEMKNKNCL